MTKSRRSTRDTNLETVDETGEHAANLQQDRQTDSNYSRPEEGENGRKEQRSMSERMDNLEAMLSQLIAAQLQHGQQPGVMDSQAGPSRRAGKETTAVPPRCEIHQGDGDINGNGRRAGPSLSDAEDEEPPLQNPPSDRPNSAVEDPEKGKATRAEQRQSNDDPTPHRLDGRRDIPNEMDRMYKMLEELTKGRRYGQEEDVARKHPFTHEIMTEPIPPNFRPPIMEMYDGAGDPMDHLQNFNIAVALHDASDAAMCRAFPSTLKGVARAWYASLGASSIHDFDQFGRLFLSHFASCRRQRRTSVDLMSLKQGTGESTRDYLSRFNKAAIEVPNLDQAIAIAAATNGLRPSRLTFSLMKRQPDTLLELLERAYKYIRADEAMAARKEVDPQGGVEEKGESQRRERGRSHERSSCLAPNCRMVKKLTGEGSSITPR